MPSQVKSVGEEEVTDWTHFDSNVSLSDNVNEIRIVGNSEAMANSFGSKQDGIKDIFIVSICRFSNMKIKIERLTILVIKVSNNTFVWLHSS